MSRVLPRDPANNDLLRVSYGSVPGSGIAQPIDLGSNPDTLENGFIIQVSDFDAFRPGQQIYFYLTIYSLSGDNVPGQQYISRVRLKPWWLRQGDDFRAPGGPITSAASTPSVPVSNWTPNDQNQFGGFTPVNNRGVWFPHPKMIDVSEWQSVNPPPAAPPRHSDSIVVDEVFTFDLQDPTSAPYQNILLPGQVRLGRSSVFQLISHGWALGLTHQFDVGGEGGSNPNLLIDLTWQTGTL